VQKLEAATENLDTCAGAADGATCQMSMLQKATVAGIARHVDEQSPKELHIGEPLKTFTGPVSLAEVPEDEHMHISSGDEVPLSEEGYSRVLRSKSKREMETFVRRIMASLGMTIEHEEGLRNMVALYDGEADKQDFQTLVDELTEESQKQCSWVLGKEAKKQAKKKLGKTAPLSEDGYKMVAFTRSPRDMSDFAERVLMREGYFLTQRDALQGLMPWHSCEKGIQSFVRLQEDINKAAGEKKTWLSVKPAKGGSSTKHGSLMLGQKSASTRGLGTTAPLNEDGYQQVADLTNNDEMGVFALRVANMLRLSVLNENRFHGFVLFYSGDQSRQSFSNLQSELSDISKDKCGWVAPMSDKHPSGASFMQGKTAPLTEEGYLGVARQRNQLEMRDFVKRVLREMKLHSVNREALLGFVPYHDCEQGAKSFAELKEELKSESEKPNSWLKVSKEREMLEDAEAPKKKHKTHAPKKEKNDDTAATQGNSSATE